MNRREFTTSLAAVFAVPGLPLPAATAAAAPTSFPPATYLWADMIARARGQVDAGFLARRLGLTSASAEALVNQLVVDGALKTPGVSGVAEAVRPFRLESAKPVTADRLTQRIATKVEDILEDTAQDFVHDDDGLSDV